MAVGKGPISPNRRTDTKVLSPSSVTKDMNELQYRAAAATQIPELPEGDKTHSQDKNADRDGDRSYLLRNSHFLISSPYNQDEHLIDLRKLSKNASLFAQALTTIKPTYENYACMPFKECLNWDHVLDSLRILVNKEDGFQWQESNFLIVEFRSTMREDASTEEQGMLDGESFAEACASGGLLKYWYGEPDAKRRNLASCEYNIC
jgi:hypothetical protein